MKKDMNYTTQEREKQVAEFVHRSIGEYSIIKTEIIINDDSDEDYTDFEVVLSSSHSDKKIHVILRHNDYEDGIDILKGEEFYPSDEKDFLAFLFISEFCNK